MKSNRRIANLASQACADTYLNYRVICHDGDCVDKLGHIEVENTYCAIYGNETIRILAFRGSDDTTDWRENFWLRPAKLHKMARYEQMRPYRPYGHPAVHGGFYESYRRIAAELRDAIDEYTIEGQRWLLTGHSLGGALACITALSLRFERNPNVVTFGCPKWGNTHATWMLGQKSSMTLRFVNNNDFVPQMPGPFSRWSHSVPPIKLRGENTGLIGSHCMFDYVCGLKRYNE